MTLVVTVRRIVFAIGFAIALTGWALHIYATYKTNRYLHEPVGKNAEGVELTRAQLLDQLIVERFVKPAQEKAQ